MSSDTQTENPYLNIGSGITLTTTEEQGDYVTDRSFNNAVFAGVNPEHKPKDKKPGELPVDKTTPRFRDANWHDKPTYGDQFSRWPEHCTLEGPKFKQFDLATQEAALDEFMLQTLPEGAPNILVETVEKQFGASSESWKILVVYHKVKYRKLLDKGSK